jgi:DNA-binding GntR family transcriptional regulator
VVRDQILSRRARPGDILRLGPIAQEMDVSITPVREALLLLAQDGWVVQEPNRGFRVTATRREDVEDTYLMWAFAEGELAVRAMNRATPGELAELQSIDARLHALGDDDTGPAGLELNRLLHSTLHRIADAPKLVWFTDAARRLIPLEFWFSFDTVPGWRALNRTAHTSIIDCMVRGDAEGARAASRQHFIATGNLLLEWLDSISFWTLGDTPPAMAAATTAVD